MTLQTLVLLAFFGSTYTQWVSYPRGPGSEKLWMPNMPSPRGLENHPAPLPSSTLQPPTIKPTDQILKQRSISVHNHNHLPNNHPRMNLNNINNINGLVPPVAPRGPQDSFQHSHNRGYNNGKFPLPPQPSPQPPQAWGMGGSNPPALGPTLRRDPPPPNRGFPQQGPPPHASGRGPHVQNNIRNTGHRAIPANSREPRPVSQQPGQLHDSWPNSNTHHHLAPAIQPTPSPLPSTPSVKQTTPTSIKVRLSTQALEFGPKEAETKREPVITTADLEKSELSAQQKEKILQMTNTLTKLSPKKPINVFMRQEGLAAVRAGADAGEVIKKFAGSSKVPFFNGTLPMSNVPPVFLAPEDMPPPYGYGKMQIPTLKKESDKDKSRDNMPVPSSTTMKYFPSSTTPKYQPNDDGQHPPGWQDFNRRAQEPVSTVATSRSSPYYPSSSSTTANPFLGPATMKPPPGYTKVLLPPGASGPPPSQQFNPSANTKTLNALSIDQKLKILNLLKSGKTNVVKPNVQNTKPGKEIKYQTNYKIIHAPPSINGSSPDPYTFLKGVLPEGAIVESISPVGPGDSDIAGSINSPVNSPFQKSLSQSIPGFNTEGLKEFPVKHPQQNIKTQHQNVNKQHQQQQMNRQHPNQQQPIQHPNQQHVNHQHPNQRDPNQHHPIQQQNQHLKTQHQQQMNQQNFLNQQQHRQNQQQQYQANQQFPRPLGHQNPPNQQQNRLHQPQQGHQPGIQQHNRHQQPQQLHQPTVQLQNRQQPQQAHQPGAPKVVVNNAGIQINMPKGNEGGLNELELKKLIGAIVKGEDSQSPGLPPQPRPPLPQQPVGPGQQQQRQPPGWTNYPNQPSLGPFGQQTQSQPSKVGPSSQFQQNQSPLFQSQHQPQGQFPHHQRPFGQPNNVPQGPVGTGPSMNQPHTIVYPQGPQTQPNFMGFPAQKPQSIVYPQRPQPGPQGNPAMQVFPQTHGQNQPHGPPHQVFSQGVNSQKETGQNQKNRLPVLIPAPPPPPTPPPTLPPTPPPTMAPETLPPPTPPPTLPVSIPVHEDLEDNNNSQFEPSSKERIPLMPPPHPPSGKPRNPLQNALSFLGIHSTMNPQLIVGKPPVPKFPSRVRPPLRKKPRPPMRPDPSISNQLDDDDDSASSESNQHEETVQSNRRPTVVFQSSSNSKADTDSNEPEHDNNKNRKKTPTIVITGDGSNLPDINRIISSLTNIHESDEEPKRPFDGNPRPRPHHFPSSTPAPSVRPHHQSTIFNNVSPNPTQGPIILSSTGRPIIQQSTPRPLTFVSSTPNYLQGSAGPIVSSTPTFIQQSSAGPIVSSTPSSYLFTNQSPHPIILQTKNPTTQFLNIPSPTAAPQQFIIQSATGAPQLVTVGGSAASLHASAVQNIIRQTLGPAAASISPSTPFIINPTGAAFFGSTPGRLVTIGNNQFAPVILNSSPASSQSPSVSPSQPAETVKTTTAEPSRSPPKKSSSEDISKEKTSAKSSSKENYSGSRVKSTNSKEVEREREREYERPSFGDRVSSSREREDRDKVSSREREREKDKEPSNRDRERERAKDRVHSSVERKNRDRDRDTPSSFERVRPNNIQSEKDRDRTQQSNKERNRDRDRESDASNDDKVIEKVRTEEKIVWNGSVPSKIRTEERTIIRPNGASTSTKVTEEKDATVEESVLSEEIVRPNPLHSLGLNFENKFEPEFKSQSPILDRNQDYLENFFHPSSSSPKPTANSQDKLSSLEPKPFSSTSFADLLTSKIKFEKMKEKLYPQQHLSGPYAENATSHSHLFSYSPTDFTLQYAADVTSTTAVPESTSASSTSIDPNGRFKIRPGDLAKHEDMTPVHSITPSTLDHSMMAHIEMHKQQPMSYVLSSTAQPSVIQMSSSPASEYPGPELSYFQMNGGGSDQSIMYSPSDTEKHQQSQLLTGFHPTAPSGSTLGTESEEKLLFFPSSTRISHLDSSNMNDGERLIFFPSSTPKSEMMAQPTIYYSSPPPKGVQNKLTNDFKIIDSTVRWDPFELESSTPSTTTTTTTTAAPTTTTTPSTTTTSIPTTTASNEVKPITWRPTKSHGPIPTTPSAPQPVVFVSSEERAKAAGVGANAMLAMMTGLSHQPKYRWQDTSHMAYKDHGASVLYAMANGSPVPILPMPTAYPMMSPAPPIYQQPPYQHPMLIHPQMYPMHQGPVMVTHPPMQFYSPSQSPYPMAPTPAPPSANEYYDDSWKWNGKPQQPSEEQQPSSEAPAAQPSVEDKPRYRNKYRVPETIDTSKKLIPVYVHKGSRRNRYRTKPTTSTSPPLDQDQPSTEYEDEIMKVEESIAGKQDKMRVSHEEKPRAPPINSGESDKSRRPLQKVPFEQPSIRDSTYIRPELEADSHKMDIESHIYSSKIRGGSQEKVRMPIRPIADQFLPVAKAKIESLIPNGDIQEDTFYLDTEEEIPNPRQRVRPAPEAPRTTTTTTAAPSYEEEPSGSDSEKDITEELVNEKSSSTQATPPPKKKVAKFSSGSDEIYDDYDFKPMFNVNFKLGTKRMPAPVRSTTPTPSPPRRRGSGRRRTSTTTTTTTTTTAAPASPEDYTGEEYDQEPPKEIPPSPSAVPVINSRRKSTTERTVLPIKPFPKYKSSEQREALFSDSDALSRIEDEHQPEPKINSESSNPSSDGFPAPNQFARRTPTQASFGNGDQNFLVHPTYEIKAEDYPTNYVSSFKYSNQPPIFHQTSSGTHYGGESIQSSEKKVQPQLGSEFGSYGQVHGQPQPTSPESTKPTKYSSQIPQKLADVRHLEPDFNNFRYGAEVPLVPYSELPYQGPSQSPTFQTMQLGSEQTGSPSIYHANSGFQPIREEAGQPNYSPVLSSGSGNEHGQHFGSSLVTGLGHSRFAQHNSKPGFSNILQQTEIKGTLPTDRTWRVSQPEQSKESTERESQEPQAMQTKPGEKPTPISPPESDLSKYERRNNSSQVIVKPAELETQASEVSPNQALPQKRRKPESVEVPRPSYVNRDMFMVSGEDKENVGKVDLISAEDKDPFRLAAVGNPGNGLGMSLTSNIAKDTHAYIGTGKDDKKAGTGAKFGFTDEDLPYTVPITTSTTTTPKPITVVSSTKLTATPTPTSMTLLKEAIQSMEYDDDGTSDWKQLLKKLADKLMVDDNDNLYDYYDQPEIFEPTQKTTTTKKPVKSKSKVDKLNSKAKGKSKNKGVSAATKKSKTARVTTTSPKPVTPKPTAAHKNKSTLRPTRISPTKKVLATTTKPTTTTTPPTTTTTTLPTTTTTTVRTTPITSPPETTAFVSPQEYPVYHHPDQSRHPGSLNPVSYILPSPKFDASVEVNSKPPRISQNQKPLWVRRKVNGTLIGEPLPLTVPGTPEPHSRRENKRIRLVRKKKPVDSPKFAGNFEYPTGVPANQGQEVPISSTTVLPIESMFDTSLHKRVGGTDLFNAGQGKRKLKLVRKGNQAQWKLRLNEDAPQDDSGVPQAQQFAAPRVTSSTSSESHQPQKSVRMESSVAVETRVCIRGKCKIVTKN